MKTQYFAAEISETQKEYMDQRRYLRESLVLRYKPELLDGEPDLTKPDLCDNDSIQELYRQLQLRSERIEQIPDREMPMDFHIFEIKKEGGRMEIEIDYIWDVLGISYSGNKKEMRYLRKIARDIYLYYGVSEEDIRDRTERYQALVTALCG